MKNKSGIIALTAIVTALCIYYLSFTFKSRSIEKDAIEYATDSKGILNEAKKRKYLDSLWTSNDPVYNLLVANFTYKEVKEKELSLGLDLQGGMHVTLEVSPMDIIKGKASDAQRKNPKFLKALEKAQEKLKNTQGNFVDLFVTSYNEVDPGKKLYPLFLSSANKDKINSDSRDSDVIKMLKKEVKDGFDRAFIIIRNRIDKFGVTNPNIQKVPGTSRILVELPGVDNPERVRKLLSGVAKLEFWKVVGFQEVYPYLQKFSKYVQEEEEKNKPTKKGEEEDNENKLIAETDSTDETSLIAETEETDTTDTPNLIAETDSIDKDSTDTKKDSVKKDSTKVENTLQNQLLTPSRGGFIVKMQDTSRVNELLRRPEVKSIFPSNMKLLWGVKGDEKSNSIVLYTLKTSRGGKPVLSGDVVTDAGIDYDRSQPVVNMEMNNRGAKTWKRVTAEASQKQEMIAIVLDNAVYSAPTVNTEIPNGRSQISGNFTVAEALDLANVLKAGKLPAPVRIVEEATVGPSLGKESINQGLTSILIGLSLVVVFMILYYKSSGVIANLALFLNIFFIVGVLAQFGAVLTLPGIAGIVLTIGMSVDANVLIYERIREELSNNKNLKVAIKLGYEKAYSSIIDANATTFLTALILYNLGSGPVKGFAVTLMIGIICSLFSAIFITRLIIEFFLKEKENKGISFDSLILKHTFQNVNIDFVGMRKKAYIGSGAIITVGLILLIIKGLTLGVDFKGGRSYVVEFENPVSVNEIRSAVDKELKGSNEVKTFGGNNKLKITTTYLIDDESAEADEKAKSLLLKGLDKHKDQNPEIISFSKVGSTIADDIAKTSYYTIFFTLLVVFLYIVIRFQKWQFGLGALVALIHDVLVVLSFMGFAKLLGFSYEIDQVFIAAMLTVVGYSINDTVVVFDRIREFAGDTQASNFSDKLNGAINNTLSRTVMTSSTTLVVVLILFLLGGEVLRGFSYSLLIGILIGTYSSVFIASPIVLDISLLNLKKTPKPAVDLKK